MENNTENTNMDNNIDTMSTLESTPKNKVGGIFSGAKNKKQKLQEAMPIWEDSIKTEAKINTQDTVEKQERIGLWISSNKTKETENTPETEEEKTQTNKEKKVKKEKKKKKVDVTNIKNFKGALGAIKTYTYIQEWEKAENAIVEIKEKEANAFANLKKSLKSNYKESEKQQKIYKKNQLLIEKAEKRLTLEKFKYEKKIEKERFAVRFDTIKEAINKLTKTGKNTEALNLLTHFLEENQERTSVVTFYDKEKKKILKNIQKKQKKDKWKNKMTAEAEALKLIWKTVKLEEQKKKKEKKEKNKFVLFGWLRDKLNIYQGVKNKLKKKKLLDEVQILIEEETKAKKEIAEKKLENIHKWLVKEIVQKNMSWYDFYGKILGYDKISGDSFGFMEQKHKYNFFIWDATGHGVRAWLIVSMLNRNFQDLVHKNDLKNLVLKTNNDLKENLKNRNFVTWIFFEIDKDVRDKVKFVGLWHEPLFVFRKKTNKVEKIIPGWLAAWIREIKKIEDIVVKEINVDDGDIIMTYSDWVVEAKDSEGKFYGLERLQKKLAEVASYESNINNIYDYLIEDLKLFKGWKSLLDDTTIMLVRRNFGKDIIWEESVILKELSAKEGLNMKQRKRLSWKSREEIEEELAAIKKEKETENIIKNLETLYLTWEIIKLKQEATRHIKEWYIHKKINYYLKKAIANESVYKTKQKNQKMHSKYVVLSELYKKKDYATVIREINEIIAHDWNV